MLPPRMPSLPVNPPPGPLAFTANPLDRADHLRTDAERLAAIRAGGAGRVLLLDGLAPLLDDGGALQWADLPADDIREMVLLGLADDGTAAFAAVPAEGDSGPAYAHRSGWGDIARMALPDLAIYGAARSLIDWHARHRFCAMCGQPTHIAKGGWQRNCGPGGDGAEGCSAQHFPRVDPVAIMLVEHDGDLLMGRQSRFPPRSFSALAGFVEPGESIEEAVAREVLEEAGVTVSDVRYITSQPWPFPSQLMIGCHSFANSRDLVIDYTELQEARWFTRAQVAEAVARGEQSSTFLPPPPRAIAYRMLEWWLEQEA